MTVAPRTALDRAKLIKLAVSIGLAVLLFFYPSYQQDLVNVVGASNSWPVRADGLQHGVISCSW